LYSTKSKNNKEVILPKNKDLKVTFFPLHSYEKRNTGAIACYDILTYMKDVEELFVVGFSFHTEKNTLHAKGYTAQSENFFCYHKEADEKEFFKQFVINNPKSNIHDTTLKALDIKRSHS